MAEIRHTIKRRLNGKPARHKPWPWQSRLMYCPHTRAWHMYGCRCVRDNPALIPASVRGDYQMQWAKGN